MNLSFMISNLVVVFSCLKTCVDYRYKGVCNQLFDVQLPPVINMGIPNNLEW